MESWLSPMLCGKADVVPEGAEWVAEPKMDGWRAVAHVNGKVNFYCGRNGSSYSGKLPYIESALALIFPPDSAVDGELLGGEWGDVQGVMTRGDGPHVPSPLVPALSYVVFDVTRYEGADLRSEPWRDRRDILERCIAAAREAGNAPNHIQVSPAGPSSAAVLDRMIGIGMEGVVCKRRDSRYVNSRSNLWIKVKPQDTEDGEIIGFYDATPGSKYEGNSVGGLCFRLANGYEGRAAGMKDDLRAEMYDHPERFIGRTVELVHHGVQAKTGALRHPNFLRFRDDKDPPPKPKTAPKVQTTAKMRNYAAMGDKKLVKVRDELESGGDAAERCGPENVERDLAVVRGLVAERGLE